MTNADVSIVIPTLDRGVVLIATIEMLLRQSVRASNIIVVDQSDYADASNIATTLAEFESRGDITWIRLSMPSIPVAMNQGLLAAQTKWVLFLDDDVKIDSNFIAEHIKATANHDSVAQVGSVLQPRQTPVELSHGYRSGRGLWRDLSFPFHSNTSALIFNCMAGNLLVKRAAALEVGGFDERFVGAAYRFETEFCRRMIRRFNQPFYFAPNAIIHHLQAPHGGTRSLSSPLTSISPNHSIGDYYFAFRCGSLAESLGYAIMRMTRSMVSRFYLRHPWYIPLRLIAEARGLVCAIYASLRPPKYLKHT